jgi:hypothetical protein
MLMHDIGFRSPVLLNRGLGPGARRATSSVTVESLDELDI